MTNNKPSLLIMAAGMGSRYGGLKQIDAFGPNKESILHYSIYDTLKTGFGKIYFIIRKDTENEFNNWTSSNFPEDLDYEFIFQEKESYIPSDKLSLIKNRQKPWGTAHAILCAKGKINTNFAVINADDFYGRNAFEILSNYLQNQKSPAKYAMVGYSLEKTLSENGTVSRGICEIDPQSSLLIDVEEHLKLAKDSSDNKVYDYDKEPPKLLPNDTVVSVNCFGFSPDIFEVLQQKFETFLEKNIESEKGEFFIPFVIDEMIKENKATLEVLFSNDNWFGVTYREDKVFAQNSITRLIEKGEYPKKLF